MATEISWPRVLELRTESRLRAWEFLKLIVKGRKGRKGGRAFWSFGFVRAIRVISRALE